MGGVGKSPRGGDSRQSVLDGHGRIGDGAVAGHDHGAVGILGIGEAFVGIIGGRRRDHVDGGQHGILAGSKCDLLAPNQHQPAIAKFLDVLQLRL